MAVSLIGQSSPWSEVTGTHGLGGLNESLVLNPLTPVSFHWADFQDSCREYQQRIGREPRLKAEYEGKLSELNKLNAMPVWIRSERDIVHTTLFDLYQDFILERMWQQEDAHPHAPYDISFISPSGPYKKLAITDCFNLQTYQDFILVYLLQNRLPQRDFRLRAPSRLLMEFGNGLSDVGLMDLEQISSTGVLLKCPAKQFFQKVRPSQHVKLMFKTATLEQSITTWGHNPFYSHNKQEAFTLNCADFQIASRFDFSQTQMVYLFVRFEALKASNAIMAQKIERFILRTRDDIRDRLKVKNVA